MLMALREWKNLPAESRHNINQLWRALEGLHELVLEMGHEIRLLDEDCRFNEHWTQDGEYILDDKRYDLAMHVLGYDKEE